MIISQPSTWLKRSWGILFHLCFETLDGFPQNGEVLPQLEESNEVKRTHNDKDGGLGKVGHGREVASLIAKKHTKLLKTLPKPYAASTTALLIQNTQSIG